LWRTKAPFVLRVHAGTYTAEGPFVVRHRGSKQRSPAVSEFDNVLDTPPHANLLRLESLPRGFAVPLACCKPSRRIDGRSRATRRIGTRPCRHPAALLRFAPLLPLQHILSIQPSHGRTQRTCAISRVHGLRCTTVIDLGRLVAMHGLNLTARAEHVVYQLL